MTWRIRLRTDINQTEILGIRFNESDVRKPPERTDKDMDDEDRPESPASWER
jgi:hypothetical protein